MVDKLNGLLGIIFVLSTLLSEASCVDTVIGHFHMVQKIPELKECATTMLQENECVAVRRSRLTGQCESLPHSWGKDEIMESGYDYAKKIFVQENFQPPRQVELLKTLYWKIPGVFKTGAKVDAFILLAPEFQGPSIHLTSLLGEIATAESRGHQFVIRFLADTVEVSEGSDESKNGTAWPVKAVTNRMVKMSWLAQPDSVVVFVNDVELLTYQFKARLDIMRQIYFSYDTNVIVPATIDRLQLTAYYTWNTQKWTLYTTKSSSDVDIFSAVY